MIGVDRYIIEKTDTVSVYAVDDESESSRGDCPEHGVIVSQFSVDRHSSGFKKYGIIGSMAFAVYE